MFNIEVKENAFGPVATTELNGSHYETSRYTDEDIITRHGIIRPVGVGFQVVEPTFNHINHGKCPRLTHKRLARYHEIGVNQLKDLTLAPAPVA